MSEVGPMHVAQPDEGHGPGVLVLHEAWGLTPDIRWATEELGRAGYVAAAPDLTHVMGGLMGSITQLRNGEGRLIDEALRAVDWLADRETVAGDRLGVVGFSMGAALGSLLDRHPRVSVLGFNYGMVPPAGFSVRGLPTVASFGARDRLLPRAASPLRAALADSIDAHDIEVYDGVGHSFMTPFDPSTNKSVAWLVGAKYDAVAAGAAWSRLLGFFNRHLAAIRPG